ncbi:MAG: LuxR C-terminal-related transcriptional regulator [Solirubrobacteraceae bacterium]|nr:LuxR C-terminal-related transcriptional regulator [Solirubrobacteraceae bacterium]
MVAEPAGPRRTASPRARADALLRRLHEATGTTTGPAGRIGPEDLEAAADAVARRPEAWEADPAATAALVRDAHALALELDARDNDRRARRITSCQQGLARLRSAATTDELLRAVCEEAVRACGLERVLLSRVEDGRWWPWKVNAAVAPEDWVADWRDRSIPLDALTLESRLLDEHRPALVSDTSEPGIHEIIRAGRSSSYVVAPVMPAGRVIGFLHADHLEGGPACDATDRDVLWRFAEGFGHLYERTVLGERMRRRRTEFERLIEAVHDAMADLTAAEVRLSQQEDPGEATGGDDRDTGHLPAPGGRPPEGLAELLTPREREVFSLLVAGRRNRQIAEALAIGEGTVKTHVKRVLAKTGATNRAELVARHHRDGPG